MGLCVFETQTPTANELRSDFYNAPKKINQKISTNGRHIMLKTKSLALSLLFSLGLSATASATVITFDDLPATESDAIAAGYHGLNWGDEFWTSVAYMHKDTLPGTGFETGVISGNYAAFNNFATTSTITGDIFTFNGTYLTAAWNNGLNIEVSGFLNDVLLFTQTVIVTTTNAQWFDFNYNGINKLSFRSWGGSPTTPGEGGEHFVMDNFTINESAKVPESSPLALLLIGLTAIAFGRRAKTH